MANRMTLHRLHEERFSNWMIANGFARVSPKGEYEAMRFVHVKREHAPVIIFRRGTRKADDHFTVMDSDYALVQRFLHDTKQRKTPRSKRL